MKNLGETLGGREIDTWKQFEVKEVEKVIVKIMAHPVLFG